MGDLQMLQRAGRDIRVLCVEDNDALRENLAKFLKKIFAEVSMAVDGVNALSAFHKRPADLLITDIKMPNMDGLELAKKIRRLSPQAQIILISGTDDKEYLYASIKLGVCAFLKKPIQLPAFTTALEEALKNIKAHKHQTILTLEDFLFNNQSAMVMMMNESAPVLANKEFLQFFGVTDLHEFTTKYTNIENTFIAEEGFLSPSQKIEWFDGLSVNEKKLFNVKIQMQKNSPKHFALSVKRVRQNGDFVLLTFDDVSDLGLSLGQEYKTKEPGEVQTNPLEFLEVLRRNGSKVHLHNYYKGLSITNDALIVDIKNGEVVLKTNYLQQKAIQYEQKTLILSETFPNAIFCEKLNKISFEEQSAAFEGLRFIKTSPVLRKTIRVVPEEEHKVTLFIHESIFHAETRIDDISMDAVKIRINAMPAGMSEGTQVILDLVLNMDKRAFSLNIEAVLFRQAELAESFSLVFVFVLKPEQKALLLRYITKRQMAIIREFKGIQHGRK
ncbi:MAG: response regulator [Sulfurimonas sp.]|nr:response regulator [Sulfurimonas sp.]